MLAEWPFNARCCPAGGAAGMPLLLTCQHVTLIWVICKHRRALRYVGGCAAVDDVEGDACSSTQQRHSCETLGTACCSTCSARHGWHSAVYCSTSRLCFQPRHTPVHTSVSFARARGTQCPSLRAYALHNPGCSVVVKLPAAGSAPKPLGRGMLCCRLHWLLVPAATQLHTVTAASYRTRHHCRHPRKSQHAGRCWHPR